MNYPDGCRFPDEYLSQWSEDEVSDARNAIQAMKNLRADFSIAINKAVDYAQLEAVDSYTVGGKRVVHDLEYLLDVLMEAAEDHFAKDLKKAREVLG